MVKRVRAGAALLAAVLLAAGASAGCDVFQEVGSNPVGVNERFGDLLFRAVRIDAPAGPKYAAGADATMWFTVINEGDQSVTLTDVRSPAARDAAIWWDRDCDGTAEPVEELPLAPAGPVPVDEASGAPPFDAYYVELMDFTRDVLAGTSVDVTFDFGDAGQAVLEVPVRPREDQSEPGTVCGDISRFPLATPQPTVGGR